MRRTIVIAGIVLIVISIFIAILAFVAADYYGSKGTYQNEMNMASFVGQCGIIVMFIGILIAIIGAVLKNEEQKRVSPSLNCPKCSREIPYDAIVCPYCQYDFMTMVRKKQS